MKEKITKDVERIKRFQKMVLGTKSDVYIKDIDIRNYAKFLLVEGTIEEKRNLLSCFKSTLHLSKKKVSLK